MATARDGAAVGNPNVRSRIITAARALAVEGGRHSVQIREIAKRTGLSSKTIYKYFSSKDLLLAEMQLQWTRDLAEVESAPQNFGGAASERILNLIRRACRFLTRYPELGRAIILMGASDNADVQRCRAEEYAIWAALIRRLLAAEAVDPDEVIDLLDLAWSGATFRWAHGVWTSEQMVNRLERAVRIILDADISGRTSLR
jgi:AcrR family transcriptional regulator